MIHDTQSAQISQNQPGYHHNGFVEAHALGHMMYGYIMWPRAWVDIYKQHYAETGKKLSGNIRNTLRLNFWKKIANKQVWLFKWDYMINCNENENDNEKWII